METAIVFPDTHIPLHDKRAWKCALKAIEIVKPDIFAGLGDTGEWEAANHWQWRKRKKPPIEYILPAINKEIRSVNHSLDNLDDALERAHCDRRIIIEGNHCRWLNYMVEENPAVGVDGELIYGDYTFRNAIMAEERGYEIYEVTQADDLFLGDLNLRHGEEHLTKYHARAYLDDLGCSVMYGHNHSVMQATKKQIFGNITAYSLGCLKLLDKKHNKWTKGRSLSWSHCIAILYIDGGKTTVQVVPITDGTIMLNGRKYVCCDDGIVRWER
jgi:hypothetical protein